MSIDDCDICGIWDSELVEGVCAECIDKYSNNIVQARETFEKVIDHPNTKIIKLKQIAKLARVSMVCMFDE